MSEKTLTFGMNLADGVTWPEAFLCAVCAVCVAAAVIAIFANFK